MKWKHLGTVKGNVELSLPSDYSELAIKCRNNDYYYTIHVIKEMASSNQIISFGATSTTQTGFVYLSENVIALTSWNMNNTNIVANDTVSMEVYYR